MKKHFSIQEIISSRIGFISPCLLSHFVMVRECQQASPHSTTRRPHLKHSGQNLGDDAVKKRRPHEKDFWQSLGADAMKKLLGLERGATKSIAIGAEIAACVTVMKDGRNLYVKKDGTYFVLLQGEAVAL